MGPAQGLAAVRAALDPYVASGRLPGYVAGWRRDGQTATCAGGTVAVDSDEPMTEKTIFRIASLSKIVGAVLTHTLVEEGRIALEDEAGRWLPELATPRVLRRIDGPLDDTVPANRPILVSDLLTMTAGFGLVMGLTPLRKAMAAAELMPGPFAPPFGHDEFMARLAALPLALQPGEGWLYHTAADVLSALLARATGQSIAELLRERIAEPLGISDMAFFAENPRRLATAYFPEGDELRLLDPPDGAFSRPPAFEALGSGLVSTVADYLAFLSILADGGGSVLAPGSVIALSGDRLTDGQRESAQSFLGRGRSWGHMVEVFLAPGPGSSLGSGSFGWMGGKGTTAYVDPQRGLTGVLLTQRAMESPRSTDYYEAFWRALSSCP